jgi:hypothetical protein
MPATALLSIVNFQTSIASFRLLDAPAAYAVEPSAGLRAAIDLAAGVT